jgi:hypothetical protein
MEANGGTATSNAQQEALAELEDAVEATVASAASTG